MSSSILARAHAQLSALARPEVPRAATAKAQIQASAELATVHIYDDIGGFGVSASELVPELAALDAPEIELRLNSGGGDYFDGVAIANALAEHPARVTVHVDGLAASAASVIAMAGDEIVMHPGSRMMIHDALTGTVGNAGDHLRAAELLDSVSQDIAALYASRADWRSADGWREAMRAESWYSASEAVSNGLATREVSRETSAPVPTVAQVPAWAQWADNRMAAKAAQIPSAHEAEAAPPVEAPRVAALPTLSELLCSALTRKADA